MSSEDDKKIKLDQLRKFNKTKQHIKVVLDTLKRFLGRQQSMDDPVARFSTFINILLLGLDLGQAGLESVLYEAFDAYNDVEGAQPEIDKIMKDYAEVSGNVQKQFTDMLRWIANPVYGPDHPLGNGIMKNAGTDFGTQNSVQQSSKVTAATTTQP